MATADMNKESPVGSAQEPLVGEHPLAALPAVARDIVAAATRLILRDGYKGLTLRAVAAEANVYGDSVRYYFGGKNGLVEAVALSLSHDLSLNTLASVRAIADEDERMRAIAEVNRRIAEDTDSYRVYWELFPHILADRRWMAREAEDYEWYRRLYAHFFPRRPAEFRDLPDPERARNMASLMVAVGDGLAVQKALDPDGVDLPAIFALWGEIVRPALAEAFGADDNALPR